MPAEAMGGWAAGAVPHEIRREMKRAAREVFRGMATAWHHGGPGPREHGAHAFGPHEHHHREHRERGG
ncbi:hypothetical protein ACFQ08_44255, partial [Streptosporangium algeriense]